MTVKVQSLVDKSIRTWLAGRARREGRTISVVIARILNEEREREKKSSEPAPEEASQS